METVNLKERKKADTVEISELNGVMVFGFFDGVHRGHRALIEAAASYADDKSRKLVIWSFSSLPKAGAFISTNEERLEALEKCGADYAVLEDFGSVCEMTPNEFFDDYVMRKYNPSAVFCGFNFRYGKRAEGGVDDLKQSCMKHGVECFVLDPFKLNDETVSSSLIRKYISEGRLEKANEMLGYPYSVTGEIIHGKHLGRKIGFATINQRIPDMKMVPDFGVYACRVKANGKTYEGVCNIGSRPTVNSDLLDVTVETHLFGEHKEMYGMIVTTEILREIRKEKKFDSVSELAEQIHKDATAVQDFFRSLDTRRKDVEI